MKVCLLRNRHRKREGSEHIFFFFCYKLWKCTCNFRLLCALVVTQDDLRIQDFQNTKISALGITSLSGTVGGARQTSLIDMHKAQTRGHVMCGKNRHGSTCLATQQRQEVSPYVIPRQRQSCYDPVTVCDYAYTSKARIMFARFEPSKGTVRKSSKEKGSAQRLPNRWAGAEGRLGRAKGRLGNCPTTFLA